MFQWNDSTVCHCNMGLRGKGERKPTGTDKLWAAKILFSCVKSGEDEIPLSQILHWHIANKFHSIPLGEIVGWNLLQGGSKHVTKYCL